MGSLHIVQLKNHKKKKLTPSRRWKVKLGFLIAWFALPFWGMVRLPRHTKLAVQAYTSHPHYFVVIGSMITT
jgi:hypothetical protein